MSDREYKNNPFLMQEPHYSHTHTHIHTNGAEPSKAIFYLKKKKIKRKEKSKAPPSSFPGLPFCLSKWVLIKKFTSSLYSA
jgi:hypothetical protein